MRLLSPAQHLSEWRFTRNGNLTLVEAPGFGSRRTATLAFLATAGVLGCWWGWRACTLFAVQLVSPSLAAGVCSLVLGVPFVCIGTTSGPFSEAAYLVDTTLRPRGPWPPAFYRLDAAVRRRLLRRAASIVVQTPEAAQELSQVVARAKIVVIPNPVRAHTACPLNGSPRAVFAGRFSQQKNLLLLIDAWVDVLRNEPDARLTLVGAGGRHETVEPDLRAAVESDSALSSSVSFSGWVADPAATVAESDVFVFPSLTEAFSLALLEACALGRVIVASDIPPNRAILGDDYPLLFPPTDSAALASTILKAFRDTSLRQRARTSVLARVREYSLDRVATQLDQVLREASFSASRRGSRAAGRAWRPSPRPGHRCRRAG